MTDTDATARAIAGFHSGYDEDARLDKGKAKLVSSRPWTVRLKYQVEAPVTPDFAGATEPHQEAKPNNTNNNTQDSRQYQNIEFRAEKPRKGIAKNPWYMLIFPLSMKTCESRRDIASGKNGKPLRYRARERKSEMHKTKLAAIAAMALGLALAMGTLAGCGSSSPAPSNTSTPAPAPAPAKFEDQIAGTWKLAAAETQGLTISGDFTEMLGMFSEESDEPVSDMSVLTINADGTGEMTFGEEKTDLEWTAAGDSATLKPTGQDLDQISGEMTLTYDKDNAAVKLQFTAEKDPDAATQEEVTLIYTADGAYADAKEISMEAATPVKDKSELEGTWRLSGMGIMGVSAYGDPDALSSLSGMDSSTSADITFSADGTYTMGDESNSWTIGADGATITTSGFSGEVQLPVKMLGEELVIDMGPVFGDMLGGTSFTFVYTK